MRAIRPTLVRSKVLFPTIGAAATGVVGVAAIGLYFAGKRPAAKREGEHLLTPKLATSDSSVSEVETAPKFNEAVAYCDLIYRSLNNKITGEPLFEFALRVARSLQDSDVKDGAVVLAALLFAAVSEAKRPLDDTVSRFGPAVGRLMQEISDAQSLFRFVQEEELTCAFDSFSNQAKLVILAQHVDMVREILESQPRGWTQWQASNHFQRARVVVAGLRGVSKTFEAEFDYLMESYDYGPSVNSSASVGASTK